VASDSATQTWASRVAEELERCKADLKQAMERSQSSSSQPFTSAVKHVEDTAPVKPSVPLSQLSLSNDSAVKSHGGAQSTTSMSKRKIVTPVLDSLVYANSNSTSSEFSYNCLLRHVRKHTYILMGIQSPLFTLQVQSQLILFLRGMKANDPSVLFDKAGAYYDRYRTPSAIVFQQLEFFVKEHSEVISEREYSTSMHWSNDTFRELEDLLRCIIKPRLRNTQLYVCAKRFLETMEFSWSTSEVKKVDVAMRGSFS
jgi:hypothetical protein